jgi:NitT/TauT family transport system substrate-binding protein
MGAGLSLKHHCCSAAFTFIDMHSISLSRRRWGALSLAMAAGMGWTSLRAQPRPLTIAVGGQDSLYYLPITIAQQLGYFAAEGVQVTLRDFAGGGLALQAVQAGAADVCAGAFEHTIRMQAYGQFYRSFVLLGRAPQLALGIAPRHMQAKQAGWQALKGKRIGVSAPGSSTHLLARMMLERAGLGEGDVQFVGVGSGQGALAAMRTGRIQALCHADPLMTMLEQRGEIRLLGDTRVLKGAQEIYGGPMPSGCLYAPHTFVQKNPTQIQALTNAIVHALKWLQTAAPGDLLKVVPEAYLLGQRGPYLAAFGKMRDTISPDGLMPDRGPEIALSALGRIQRGLSGGGVQLGRTYTNEFALRAKRQYNA